MPLSGIRIVDLTRILAGPFCTMMLADMGAEVIKVETPGVGDPLRTQGVIRDGLSAGIFAAFNATKRSLATTCAAGREKAVLARLIAGSDVLGEFSPGNAQAQMGFDEARPSSKGTQARSRPTPTSAGWPTGPSPRPGRPSTSSPGR